MSSNLRAGHIAGIVIGVVAFLLFGAFTTWFVTRRRRIQIRSSEPQPSTAAAEITKEELDKAVEARYVAEKASRTVQVTAEPIDTISIDSREHGKGKGADSGQKSNTGTSAEYVLGPVGNW